MTELSLNILDIVQNSLRAGAREVTIEIVESAFSDQLTINIRDNGCGIPEEILETVTDPFTTTRTTRKTGLGLPLLRHHAVLTGGDVSISSSAGKGTEVRAYFGQSHIDRQPLGDIAGVMIILISANPDIDFLYSHQTDSGKYVFSTDEIRRILETDRIDDYMLLQDLRMMIKENIQAIGVSD
jgi:anti-sigma regulatory factor (Ser/Thr protein kinase)